MDTQSLTKTLIYLLKNRQYIKGLCPVKETMFYSHLNQLESEGLIQRIRKGREHQILFNPKMVKYICPLSAIPKDLPAIPGTGLATKLKIGKIDPDKIKSELWLLDDCPLVSDPARLPIEHLALQLCQIYERMSHARTLRSKVYCYPHNPKKSRYWNNFIKIAQLCRANKIEPEEFMRSQFHTMPLDWCKWKLGIRVPYPNYLNSNKALERYKQYCEIKNKLHRCELYAHDSLESWLEYQLFYTLNETIMGIASCIKNYHGINLCAISQCIEGCLELNGDILISLTKWRHQVCPDFQKKFVKDKGTFIKMMIISDHPEYKLLLLRKYKQLIKVIKKENEEFFGHSQILIAHKILRHFLTGRSLLIRNFPLLKDNYTSEVHPFIMVKLKFTSDITSKFHN